MTTAAQRTRQGLALLLAVAAALAAVTGASAWIVRDALVSPDGFADRAERALDGPAVSDAIADEIAAQVAGELPSGLVPEERVATAIAEGIHTPAFAREVRANARELNGVLFGGETATATLDV